MIPAGGSSFTVNAVDALTTRGSDTFSYDRGRLISAPVAGITETSAYEGDGARVSRQVAGGSLVRFVDDPSGSLPMTVDDGAADARPGGGKPS